jgi:hypothetical protein
VCAFPLRKVHEVHRSHQIPQEIRGRTPACLSSTADREYTELTQEETAEPEESQQQANYHAYHALFSHFPNPDFLPQCTGLNRVCAFP